MSGGAPFGGAGGLAGSDVCVVANIDWSAPWQPIHELTTRLARANRVTFVETTGRRAPRPGDLPRLARRVARSRAAAQPAGIRLVSPRVLPLPRSRAAARANARIVTRLVAPERPQLVWAYLPSPTLLRMLDTMPHRGVVYHCMLDLRSLPHAPRGVERVERELVARADVVVVDSATLLRERGWSGARFHHIPGGVRASLFAQRRIEATAVAPDVAALPRPVAGFVGSIDYRLDTGLLRAAARAARHWSFALVGPASSGVRRELSREANVHVLGARPHALLPPVLAGFDACLIPYRDIAIRRTTFPAKFLEYLATGRPIVATPLADLEPFAAHVTSVGDGEELARALDASRAEPAARRSERAEVAAAHDWSVRERDWRDALAAAGLV